MFFLSIKKHRRVCAFFQEGKQKNIYFRQEVAYNIGMKLFLTAFLIFMVGKGITYVLCPKLVVDCAQKLLNTPHVQLVIFGWILIIVSAMAWLGCVRYLPG